MKTPSKKAITSLERIVCALEAWQNRNPGIDPGNWAGSVKSELIQFLRHLEQQREDAANENHPHN